MMRKLHHGSSIFVRLHLLLLLLFSGPGHAIFSLPYSKIRSLPGFSGPLPFELETGYISVGESDDVELFYYFIKSERNPREDPLLLWLTGGPGCSSFSGLAYQTGPLNFNIVEYNGSLPTLVLNPYSWTKVSNIIFLDAPVGTGFSYSKSLQGYDTGDTKSAKQTYSFLRKWLSSHSEFITNPLYVAGDSYSGMVIPIVVQEIANGIESLHKPHINLKGYLEGNPATDKKIDENSRIPFAHGMALISDELYKSARKNCKGDYVTEGSRNRQCSKDLQAVLKCTERVNSEHILEVNCSSISSIVNGIKQSRRSLGEKFTELLSEPRIPQFGCKLYNYWLSYYWANDDSVRKALHVKKGTIGTWLRCNTSLSYAKDVESSIAYHLNLGTRGYQSLIFSGDHDMGIPYIGTHAWIRSLNFPIIEDWRPWFVDTQVAGYTMTYSNFMTFATVKGGGHTASEYRPKECFAMFERWIFHNPL